MSSDPLIRRIQRAYPQIWYHCHTQHRGRGDELSEREATVLGHLDTVTPPTPSELATHLSIGASTLSEAIDKLAGRGLVARKTDESDRRRVRYTLTEAGVAALDRSSPLSSAQLRAALSRMTAEDRTHAVTGLELLAKACLPTTDDDGGQR